MAELAGGKPVVVETSIESGFLMTAEQLRQAITPASRILILCTPSNPSGAVYPLNRLQVCDSAFHPAEGGLAFDTCL